MGVVNLSNAKYYSSKLSEAEYTKEMIRYENILQCTMLKMYKTILN